MQNLRDKLLKAGLITEDQAKTAEVTAPRPKDRPPQRMERPAPRAERPARPPPARDDDGHLGAQERIPKLPPLPGSKAHQRLESRKQLETDRKLRELALAHQVPTEPGTHVFHFITRKGRLRRLEVSEQQAKLLESGALAIVERPEPAQIEHSLVPPEIADKMLALHPKSVRFFNRDGSPVGFLSDDELKAHQKAEEDAGPEQSSAAEEPSPAETGEELPSPEAGS